MSKLSYTSTKTYADIEIDLATASLDQLADAYSSLFARSDDGGAYPGSSEWKKCKVYSDQLRALIAARPEIEDYRKQAQATANAAALANTYID